MMRKIMSLVLVGLFILSGFIGLVIFTSITVEGAGLANTPWPCFRGNIGHTGLSPYDTGHITGAPKWKYETGGQIKSSPAIGPDGTIYVGSGDSHLYAIDSDGNLKWKYETVLYMGSSPAVGDDGTIYVGSFGKCLYAINPNGTQKWRYVTDGQVQSSPAIGSDGTIYVGSYDKYLYAINFDGTLKWKYETGGEIDSSPAIGSDGTIYVGSDDYYLYAINSDGTLKWRYQTGSYVQSSPAVGSDGTIYVGSYDKYLYAINSEGTLKWRYYVGANILSSPAINSDGTIYIGSFDNSMYAINPDGSLKWRCPVGGAIYSSPAIGNDGTIYFGSLDKDLYAVSSDGAVKWRTRTGGVVYSSPAIGNDGTIYIGSFDNSLYVIGSIGGPPPVPGAPQNLQAFAGDKQIVLTWDAPTNDGGSDITNYRIYRGVGTSTVKLLTTIDNVLTYTDTGLTNGQTYYYKVSAMNVNGEGPLSEMVSATPSPAEPDSDQDGLPDSWELDHFGDLSQSDSADFDQDGYTNLEEYQANTNPNDATDFPKDSDQDGLPDSWELEQFGDLPQIGTDDPDEDGYTNLQEYQGSSDPNNPASIPSDSTQQHASILDYWWVFLTIAVVIVALIATIVLRKRPPKTKEGHLQPMQFEQGYQQPQQFQPPPPFNPPPPESQQ